MTDTNESLYDVSFAGECLEGHEPGAVRAALGKLFNADEATLLRLFSGRRQRIKKSCDSATAKKYQQAMTAAGARAIITRGDAHADAAVGQEKAPPPLAEQLTPGDTSALTLAPGGTDVLLPDERTEHAPRTMELGHLSLAESGASLTAEQQETVPAVDAPNYDVADPGEMLSNAPAVEPPPMPDVSALTLAPAEQALNDAPPPAAPTAPGTTHLELAETGSDLLSQSERASEVPRAPDTSHLSLEEH